MKTCNTLLLLCFCFTVAAQTTRSFPIEQADFESAVYVKKNDRLYAAIGDVYQRDNSNSILEMDPVRGTILNKYFVGFKPSLIRASQDEQYLFFVTEGPATLKRFNLNTKRVDWSVAVPSGIIYHELREIPGGNQPWILGATRRDSSFLYLINTRNNTISKSAWPIEKRISGFDFKNDSTLIAWQYNAILELRVRRQGLFIAKEFDNIPIGFDIQGILVGHYLVFMNRKIFDLTPPTPTLDESLNLIRHFFLAKDPANGDLITVERFGTEKTGRINRYNPNNLSLKDSWQVNYLHNIYPFDLYNYFLRPLVHTGVDRYIFKGSQFVQIAWRCASRLPRPTIDGPKTYTFCNGDSAVLRTNLAPISDINWNTGKATPTISATETGIYAVRYADERGCYSLFSDSIRVNVQPGSFDLMTVGNAETNQSESIINICKGAQIELRAAPRFSDNTKWRWSTGSTERVITVGTGNYWVAAISDQGCFGSKTNIEVRHTNDTIPRKPVIRVISKNGGLSYCLFEIAVLETDSRPGLLYQWNRFTSDQNRFERSERFLFEPTTSPERVRVGNRFTCMSEFSDPVNLVFNPRPATPQIRLENNQLISNQAGNHQWFLNGNILDNALGSTIPIQGGGFYSAKFILNGCESLISNSVAVGGKTTATRDQLRSIELKIQPNPVHDELQVQLDESTGNNTRVQIISLDGKLILEQKTQVGATGKVQIPATSLAKGIYLLRIREENVQYWGRFVKL
jgi:Secretion system C-terminal sorting domain